MQKRKNWPSRPRPFGARNSPARVQPGWSQRGAALSATASGSEAPILIRSKKRELMFIVDWL